MYFLSATETNTLLQSDYDHYYDTFFKIDLKVRRVDSIDAYKQKIKKSGLSFSEKDKKRIIEYTTIIDQKLPELSLDWFDGKKASLMTWKIGYIDDKYEEGFPHTRKAKDGSIVILLSKKYIDIHTLLHEKIHVYQKQFPKDTQKYLKKYQKVGRRRQGYRSNPDINSYLYEGFNGSYLSNPLSINDIKQQWFEHPLERMAIMITNYFLL